MQSALDSYKVMLEEHRDGTVTQRQFALRDILKIVGSEPGTVGRQIIDKEVEFNGEYTEIAKIPANSRLISASMKITEGDNDAPVKILFDDESTVIGQSENGKKNTNFGEFSTEGEPSEEEVGVGIMSDNEDATGRARVVLVYETLNSMDERKEE